MRIMALLPILLSGCALSQTEAANLRAQSEPMARSRCTALGFTDQSPMPLSRCIDSAVASYMEGRVPWPRLRAAGLNFTGNEEMQALSQCIASGTSASSPQMPACFEAQRILAIQGQNQRMQQLQAMQPPPQFNFQQPNRSVNCTSNRIGNQTYTNCY